MGRTIWALAIALLAIVTTFAQLDRSARHDPAFVPLVPQPMRGFAAEQAAGIAVTQGDADAALSHARALIRVRPLPAEHLTLLSNAYLLNDDVPGAIAALQAAASRGWREPVSQLATAQVALESEQFDLAADRLSAAMAVGAAGPELQTLLTHALAQAEGREAFAERLAGGGYWQANFLTQAGPFMVPADMADLLARAARHGVQLPCDQLSRFAADLSAREADVSAFWPGDCPA